MHRDPGETIELVVTTNRKVITAETCYNSHIIALSIQKILKNIDYSLTGVTIKIGNGIPALETYLKNSIIPCQTG
ncbi:MAG: hypothetical protein LBQ98_01915 [Nitrososphaerota archaeon]|jgi:hypothetical protein|nr:hypothetical protein [Nitrososphaerota archaeon]